ncbi:MAG: hypothetical protein ABF991_00505 [Liquorilactobacillus hordei]|uniref:hypothetical protein n=1 Tax=Liquorilactobacillus hordei TaxID=468911 RepID=UPI0039E8A1D2
MEVDMEKIIITDDIITDTTKVIKKNALIAVLRDITSVKVDSDELYDIFKSIEYTRFVKAKIGRLSSKIGCVSVVFSLIMLFLTTFMVGYTIPLIVLLFAIISLVMAEIFNFCYNCSHYSWKDVPRGYGVCDHNVLLPSNDETFYQNDIEKALVRLQESNRFSTRKYSTNSIGVDSYSDKTSLTMVWVLYMRSLDEKYMPNVIGDIQACDYASLIWRVTNNGDYMKSIKEHNINFYNWINRTSELMDR